MKKPLLRTAFWPTLGAVALLSFPAWADQLSDMAGKLSSLRGDVEKLSAEYAALSADGRDQLRSLSRQKADLELELRKEQTRTSKLRRAISEKKGEIEKASSEDGELAPIFEQSLKEVQGYVESTLPFRTSDRLASLRKIEESYRSKVVSAPKALGRLWSFMEDEFRLTRENGIYQQTVVVEGSSQLAEVVRLGMVMMYFKTGDDIVGRAVKKDGKWGYELISDPEQQRAVLSLVQTFKKQIRAGYFELPAALSVETLKGGVAK